MTIKTGNNNIAPKQPTFLSSELLSSVQNEKGITTLEKKLSR